MHSLLLVSRHRAWVSTFVSFEEHLAFLCAVPFCFQGSILFILSGISAFCLSTLVLVYVIRPRKAAKMEPQEILEKSGTEAQRSAKPAYSKLELPPPLNSKSGRAPTSSSIEEAPSESCLSLVSHSQRSGSVSILNLQSQSGNGVLQAAFESTNSSVGENTLPYTRKKTTAAISISCSASSVPPPKHSREASQEVGCVFVAHVLVIGECTRVTNWHQVRLYSNCRLRCL